MVSKVDICNLALIESNNDVTIASIDEETPSARRCRRIYDVCRRELLGSYPWSFALKFKELPRIEENLSGHSYAYKYPKDCIRIINVYGSVSDYKQKNSSTVKPNNNSVAIINGVKAVLTDSDTPFALYVYDEEVEDNFDDLFIKLLYLNMALKLSKLSGKGKEELNFLAIQIRDAEEKARIQSVGEGNSFLHVEDDDYINVRG